MLSLVCGLDLAIDVDEPLDSDSFRPDELLACSVSFVSFTASALDPDGLSCGESKIATDLELEESTCARAEEGP